MMTVFLEGNRMSNHINYFGFCGLSAIAPIHSERAIRAIAENDMDGAYLIVKQCSTGEMVLASELTAQKDFGTSGFIRYLSKDELIKNGAMTLEHALDIVGKSRVTIEVAEHDVRSFIQVRKELMAYVNKMGNPAHISMFSIVSKNFYSLKQFSETKERRSDIPGLNIKLGLTYGHIPTNFMHDIESINGITQIWLPMPLITEYAIRDASFLGIEINAYHDTHAASEAVYVAGLGVSAIAGPATHLLRNGMSR